MLQKLRLYLILLHTRLKSVLKKNIIAFIPALIWAGIIAFMTLIPAKSVPRSILLISDKVLHSIIFFGLTILLVFAFIHFREGLTIVRVYFLSVILSFSFGILIEIGQYLMKAGRNGDYLDILADLSGILLAYPFIKIFRKSRVLGWISQ